MIRNRISKFLLSRGGWKIDVGVEIPQKCVISIAPHTSNWDFWYGQLTAGALYLDSKFLMKKEWFFFPMGVLLRALGGIPINRSKKMSTVEALALEFERRETLRIAISPEGTRRPTEEWKKGFYYIAQTAKVPVLLAKIDFKKRLISLTELLTPTGDIHNDFEKIRAFYKDCQGKVPANFLLPKV